MVDFFLKDEDQKLAKDAEFLDDVDLIMSPKDGALVAVAQRNGAHVCWQCGDLFDDQDRKLRGIEVTKGYARILLHAKCVNYQPKTFWGVQRGLQARRFFAKAVNSVLKSKDAKE